MTYEVERMTLGGNTLYDKLHRQFGERAANSVRLGREANARREAARQRSAAPATRTVASASDTASRLSASDTASRPAAPIANTASRPAARVLSEPRATHYASEREIYQTRNPYRARINYMKRPVTGKSDLEISIATFPQAYRAGMRAQRAIGRGIVRDRSAASARVRRGCRPGEQRGADSALEESRRVMAEAYRRGEHMRRVTNIENAHPTPKNAEGIKTPTKFQRLVAHARTLVLGKGRHSAEVRVKRSPLPIGTLALIIVCTIVIMVMISSFAEMSEYRANISVLEREHSSLEVERSRLSGLVENREDIRVIEKIATEEIGMVSAELAQGRFVSLADSDRVEVIRDETPEQSGVFATILSSISENLGSISDYIN